MGFDLKTLEEKLGLPNLKDVTNLAIGPAGKRIDTVLARLEVLSKDTRTLKDAIDLLKLVQELDKAGTLERLIELLKGLKPLTQGRTAQALVEKLDKMEKLLAILLKEED